MARPYASTKGTESLSSAERPRTPASAPWIGGAPARLVVVLAAALGVAACGADAAQDEAVTARIETSSDPTIFGGARDDDGDGAPGVVALRVGAGGSYELCTGALVAPNVVLTARHCVTKNLTTSVACDENGQSANGKHVEGTEEPGHIAVFVGASPSFAQQPSSFARAVVAPNKDVLCDTDIALVVLERAITSVEPLAVRLSGGTQPGETVRSVGYGQNDRAMPIGTRFRKEGVEVLAMGKAVSASKTPLGRHEFEVGKSICQGDSGGPAISEATGAVIGVVSRGGGCTEDHGHIYTTTSGWDDMFAEAFGLAGTAPIPEDASGGARFARAGRGAVAPAEDETSAASCASAPRGARSGAGVFGIALATALVVRQRRRASA